MPQVVSRSSNFSQVSDRHSETCDVAKMALGARSSEKWMSGTGNINAADQVAALSNKF